MDLPVEVGSLPEGLLGPLVDVVSGFSHGRCWFCVYGIWFGGAPFLRVPSGRLRAWRFSRRLRREARQRARREQDALEPIPKVGLMRPPEGGIPQRRYLLFSGAIEAVSEAFARWRQSPNYWWPDDRTWVVATGVDATSTYVAVRPPSSMPSRPGRTSRGCRAIPGTVSTDLGDTVNLTPESP